MLLLREMPRHLSLVHNSETEVAQIISKTSGRKLAFQQISDLGVFKHISKVLREGDVSY